MPNDDDKLSVDRSSLTTARDAYNTFIANGFKSDAVYGVTVGEFNDHDLKCYSDPKTYNTAHSYADFSHRTRSAERKRLAKKLRDVATARGCLYQP